MSSLLVPEGGAQASVAQARRDALLSLCGLAALLLWDASGSDLRLMHFFGTAQGFAWRDHWLTAGVLHEGGRWLSRALGLLTILLVLRPVGPWRGVPRSERVWALAIVASCLLLVPLIKRHSSTSCPWSLEEFGGVAHYVSHWRLGLGDGGPGHCFPSGHASGAFSFLALAFVLRSAHPLAARWMLASIVGIGLLFGLAQTARGAHYPSHTLYTAWLCWTLTACAYAAWQLRRRPALLAVGG